MNLKWDVNKNEKVVVWAADTPITLIGFSSNKSSVRKATHFMTFVRFPEWCHPLLVVLLRQEESQRQAEGPQGAPHADDH